MTSEQHRKKRLNVVIEANIDARTASYVLDKIAQFAHDTVRELDPNAEISTLSEWS